MQRDLSRIGIDAFHQLSQGFVTLSIHNRLRDEYSRRRSDISTYSAIGIKRSGTESAFSTTRQESPSCRIQSDTQANVKFLGGMRVLVVCEPFESIQKPCD